VFNLFTSRKSASIEVVKPGRGLTKRMGDLIALRQDRLDELGDSHGDVDLRLVLLIKDVLEPLLGAEGCEDEPWFHLMDYYGNGVRHLEFKPGAFPMSVIPALQALLVGEHQPFSILCWAPLSGDPPPEQEQGLVIFSDKLLITAKLAGTSALVGITGRGAGV
jgi:hypothetical protein